MASADTKMTDWKKKAHKKSDFNAKMDRLMSDQEYLRAKERALYEIKETLLKTRGTTSDEISKNEDSIFMVDKSIAKNEEELSRTNSSIAEYKDILEFSTKRDMKSMVLGANHEMVSWIMEGYALQPDLANCLVRLLRQPSCCKIPMGQGNFASHLGRPISDEMRHALFHDGAEYQHRFGAQVEFLALCFMYEDHFISHYTNTHIYARCDSIMQIAMHFLGRVDEVNLKGGLTWSIYGDESINKSFCSNGGTTTRNQEKAGSTAEQNPESTQLSPSAETFPPYRDFPSGPIFLFGKEGKFPCFLMKAAKDGALFVGADDLRNMMVQLNERTFSGLPFYISAVITLTEAQFFLSEYNRPIKELGKIYRISEYNGAAEFLLAFLNLLPIFNGLQKILDADQPAWNVNITSSLGINTPISEKRHINSEEYVAQHIYFQKKIDATHKEVSSWEDLLYTYSKLAEEPVPDSLATLIKGHNLAEIFTCGAKTFTIRLLPLGFPGRTETFLTSYRLVAQCFYDILSALKWLHMHDIVHRDVVGRNILKKMCKKGFVLTGFECSARCGGKFSRDVRIDDELPSRFTKSDSADTDKWFPWDDVEQLCKFLGSAISMVSSSNQNLHLFENLFDRAAIDSAFRKLIEIDCQADTAKTYSEILHEIDICFKEYKSPFE